jgi:hypothetical protein
MRSRERVIAVTAACIAAVSPSAGADDAPTETWQRARVAVAGHFGVADPFGLFGGELEVAPLARLPQLSVVLGGGAGRRVPLGS